jgi:hypothetical protein
MVNETYANVPGNKVATYKQLKALGFKFANLHGGSNTYGMSKVFTAILVKYQNENPKTPITHTDVQNFFEAKEIPAKFVKQIKVKGTPKSSKKTVTKVSTKTPKESPKAVTTPKESPAASDQSVEDFKNSLNSLKTRMTDVEKRQATLETKFDLLWAFVQEELGK